MKKVSIKVTVTSTITLSVDDNEDVTKRQADIYLHGFGEDSHMDKVDIGGNTTIEILKSEPIN